MPQAINRLPSISQRSPTTITRGTGITVALRARECASLTPASFLVEADGMSVRVAANITKNGKEALIPVPACLASLLTPWLKNKLQNQKLWPGSWYRQAAEMLSEDLTAAKVPFETQQGPRLPRNSSHRNHARQPGHAGG